MAWRRIDDKPLSVPMQIRFIDAYMRLGGDELKSHNNINVSIQEKINEEIAYHGWRCLLSPQYVRSGTKQQQKYNENAKAKECKIRM